MTRPAPIDPLELYDRPARLGELSVRARRRAHGDEVWVRESPGHPLPAVAARLRAASTPEASSPEPSTTEPSTVDVVELSTWPEPDALRSGDRLVIHVPSTVPDRERYVAWLRTLASAAPDGLSIAPCCEAAGGMHRLWCIAAARVLLPDPVRVEARHDLIGIRLAQIAVGFGADTLAGPIEPDRSLPLAGVTRPNEGTAAGLSTLVRQVGLTPRGAAPSPAPTPNSETQP